MSGSERVLAVSGGVGGAKLALGLNLELDSGQLDVIVNTGDDFTHLGLHISPDVDTLLYTLAGVAHPEQGWGIAGESFNALDALGKLGAATWFRLGDRDLATHLLRTEALQRGASLAEATSMLAERLGIQSSLHPMSDDPVRTIVQTDSGDMPFQEYFVREQCAPEVRGFNFAGVQTASPSSAVMSLLEEDVFDAIVFCPSNPFVSIDPVLALPGLWQALAESRAPVLLICPIVNGRALKGPAAKMMAELGLPVTAEGVAQHYQMRYPGLIDYFVLDETDVTLADTMKDFDFKTVSCNTVMSSEADKRALARFALQLAEVA